MSFSRDGKVIESWIRQLDSKQDRQPHPGADRTGIRLSPCITQQNMADEEIVDVILKAASEIERVGLVYVALTHYLPVDDPNAFLDVELPIPEPTGTDLRIAIKAIAVNPIDTKVRAPKDKIEDPPRVLDRDASGVLPSAPASAAAPALRHPPSVAAGPTSSDTVASGGTNLLP